MTTQYLGSLTVGDVCPGVVAVGAAGAAGITAVLPTLQTQLDALLAFTPPVISFADQLLALQNLVAAVQAMIASGLTPPTIAGQLAELALSIAALQGQIGAINVQLSLITGFQALLGGAGVHAYAFQGQTAFLGPELSQELAGGAPGGFPTDAANALVLLTTVPAVWAALAQILKVTP